MRMFEPKIKLKYYSITFEKILKIINNNRAKTAQKIFK